MEVSKELDKAHKGAAGAAGMLVAQIARRRFSERFTRKALEDLKTATAAVENLLSTIRGED